jgi:hypothetical protein
VTVTRDVVRYSPPGFVHQTLYPLFGPQSLAALMRSRNFFVSTRGAYVQARFYFMIASKVTSRNHCRDRGSLQDLRSLEKRRSGLRNNLEMRPPLC